MCLATDAVWLQIQGSRVRPQPGPILSWIDHEIISMVILLPYADSFKKIDALAVCRAYVGFLLLRYSVVFTIESLSLLYLLVLF